MKRVYWAIFLSERDDAVGDNALIILVSGIFWAVTHSCQEKRGRAWSHSCPKHTALRASPTPNNSLDHLTSIKSHLWALCKKQCVTFAPGGLILPSTPSWPGGSSLVSAACFLRLHPHGVLLIDSAPHCWDEDFGRQSWLSSVAVLASFLLWPRAAQSTAVRCRSCTKTVTYCTLVGYSGKFMYNFSLFRSSRNTILREKWASTELNGSKNGSYQVW